MSPESKDAPAKTNFASASERLKDRRIDEIRADEDFSIWDERALPFLKDSLCLQCFSILFCNFCEQKSINIL
ncbi:MAG: hypothetical protein CVU44_13200 [Chloroflexi bacterium HGW-Chloroflexi-6]|nr:MAG: hypothetical protein CVU44_13200 [Chloroflexi bacterium HGW-Chloroflexi-6]